MPIHYPKPGKDLTGINSLLFMAAVFAASMGAGIFTFTLPLVNLDDKASGLWLGSGFAGYFLAKLLIAPLSGRYADHKGIRTPLLASCILGTLLPLPYLLLPHIDTLYAIQFALGLCAGTIRTVSMAAIGSTVKGEHLNSQFAHLSAVMNSSFLLGPILGGLLYINKDYLPVLEAMGAFMAAAFFLFLFSAPPDSCRITDSRETTTIRSNPLSHMNIMLALFGRALGIGSLIAFYPVLLQSSLKSSPGLTAAIFSIPSLTTVILLPLSGRFLAEYDRRITTSLGMLISAAALFLVAGCRSVPEFVLAGAISGIGAAISMPASMAICAELGSRKGKIMGFANVSTNLGFMTGPLLCGIMVTLAGNITYSFRMTAIAGALAALPVLHEGIRRAGFTKTAHSSTAILCTALLAVAYASIQPPAAKTGHEMFRYSDVAMGTVVNLTISGPVNVETEKTARETVTLMHNLQKDLDHRNRRGSIGRINHSAGKKGVKISDKAFETIIKGLEFSRKSKGSFDITIGAITTTPFYYALSKDRFSGHEKLIDYRKVLVDKAGKKIKLPQSGMAIDLGGLAKGTIIDAAAGYLKQSGISTAMVEAGGDFMVFGDRLWSIGIRNPRGEGIIGYIEVQDRAVCGSGDYYQFIDSVSESDKTRKHHIFDPALLQSSAECIATTTIAPDAETADALATTVFIMGPEKGSKFMTGFFPDSAAMWILQDRSIRKTQNFPNIIQANNQLHE